LAWLSLCLNAVDSPGEPVSYPKNYSEWTVPGVITQVLA